MSDDEIQITVDGRPLTAKRGQMLIEVTDAAGVDVPRFCYHKKLSVAANCRMCLVEVEKAPKPLPACATPVMPDMVVHTQSKLAREAQQGTMEFLLINHPLDCPICDQGGECELQDVAMGYGGSASQYTEGKRVVMDKYIGPLIATEMTRCIHCTRCVRFGEEIAGIRELGATGRGENVRIGTYIEKSVVSEVSGNVIDICPVGALTARPSRYSARSWELRQIPSISPHDSVGANTFVHLDGDRVNRVVPRDNEIINETWISDRDRFSYQGLRSEDRITSPRIRDDNGELVACDWLTALEVAAKALKAAGSDLGVLVSASLPLEDLYLAQKLGRALGSANIDHRLGQSDFAADDGAPVMPWLGMQFNDLEALNAALLIGSNIRKDQPIAALRLRKSAEKGASINCINPKHFPLHFDVVNNIATRYDNMVAELVGVCLAAGADLSGLIDAPPIKPLDYHKRIASALQDGEKTAVFLGNIAVQHPAYSQLLSLSIALAKACDATLSLLPERANTAGAWLAGVLPHREAGGKSAGTAGKNAGEMLSGGSKNLLLVGVEVEFDAAHPAHATAALKKAESVVALSSFMSDSLRRSADVVLPIAIFAEAFGTYVNAAGTWQSGAGSVPPLGDSRPAWKVFRVLAESLELKGFGFDSPESVARELAEACTDIQLNNLTQLPALKYAGDAGAELVRAGETPIYATDPLVRRSMPLQKTADGKQAFASMSDAELSKQSLSDGDRVLVRQNGSAVTLPAKADNNIPAGCVWVPTALPETSELGQLFGPIEVSKA
ncbi:NADH-quinone oxidoreductase subunit NuoG [uncultured Tateyamaria sp.]|uniref:NADH-quinone oxidoreductase subunit NuoG n=1 Tax=uncultured Tateyamaria sp. TaxID=455651 RepID=UPI0026100E38|nr:NADH-quinone oxidoreductase subunit NuoG [uncultured Tateyamaria sp.]